MTTRLPLLLENIRIATPCHADWNEMSGDARARLCARCDKTVFDLSQMTRVEAEALVAERTGNMCVRLYRRTDGTVITSDCPVGVKSARFRARVFTSMSKLAVGAGLVLGIGLGRARADLDVTDGKKNAPAVVKAPEPVMMGAMAAPEPPAKKPEKKPAKTVKAPKPKPPEKPQAFMGDISEPQPTPPSK